MNLSRVQAVANAVLYEGYMLYPYRPSSLKNRRPWTWGVVAPRAYSESARGREPWAVGCQCLLAGGTDAVLEARVRFLRPGPDAVAAAEVEAGPVTVGALAERPFVRAFADAGPEVVHGALEIESRPAGDGVVRLDVRVVNRTPLEAVGTRDRDAARERALACSMASVHVVLGVRGGAFVPPRDPPEALRHAVAACRADGLWPILVGEPGERDLLLCSPIILDDYPRVAPESPGDFFDGTEIDEILILRLLTLTDDEKQQMAEGDERVRALLARAEAMPPERLARLHGAVRPPAAEAAPRTLRVGGRAVTRGTKVRLRPGGRADIFDIALAGRTATVLSVEEDFDGRLYLTVTVDDDPGRDLGASGQPGHRFFFAPEEVEAIAEDEA